MVTTKLYTYVGHLKQIILIDLFQVHGKDANANGYDSDDSDEASSTTTPSLVSPSSNRGTTPGPQSNPPPPQAPQGQQPPTPQQQQQPGSQQQQQQQTIVSHSDWYCSAGGTNINSTAPAQVTQTSLPTPPSNDHSPVQQPPVHHPVHPVLQHQHHQQHHLLQPHHHLHHHSIGGLISAVQSTY